MLVYVPLICLRVGLLGLSWVFVFGCDCRAVWFCVWSLFFWFCALWSFGLSVFCVVYDCLCVLYLAMATKGLVWVFCFARFLFGCLHNIVFGFGLCSFRLVSGWLVGCVCLVFVYLLCLRVCVCCVGRWIV